MHRKGQFFLIKAIEHSEVGPQWIQSRMRILDIILMNITITYFILYSLSQHMTPTISNIRWITLGAWTGLLILRIALKRKKLILRIPLSGKIAAIMLVWFLITIFLSSNSLSFSLQKYLAVLWLFIVGYFLFPVSYYNTKFKTVFVVCLSAQFSFYIIYGFWINVIPNLQYLGFRRQFGLFSRPSTPALMAGSLLILSFCLIVFRTTKKRNIILMILSIVLGTLAIATIYATGTRTALISTGIIVLVWLLIFNKKYRILVASACLLVLLFEGLAIIRWYRTQPVFERPTTSGPLAGRMNLYRLQMDTFLEKPIIGTGFASNIHHSADDSVMRAMSHSAYLGALVETGTPGGLLFLCWIAVSLYEVFREARRHLNRWVDQFSFMFIGMLALSSMVESFLMMAGNILILTYYVLIGISTTKVRPSHRIKSYTALNR